MKIGLWSDMHWNKSNLATQARIKTFMQKIPDLNLDVLILAGDMATSHVIELRSFLIELRAVLPDLKIVWVFGNHDLAGDSSWRYSNKLLSNAPAGFSQVHMSLAEIFAYLKDLEHEFNIFHLKDEPFSVNNILITGFDGWYAKTHPGALMPTVNEPIGVFQETTDRDKLPPITEGMDSMRWLTRKARKDLNELLSLDKTNYHTKICVTHFPPYTFNPKYKDMIADESFLPLLCEEFNYLLVGHSHRDEEWTFKNCKIINCGNDYDKCQLKVIDLSAKTTTTIGEN